MTASRRRACVETPGKLLLATCVECFTSKGSWFGFERTDMNGVKNSSKCLTLLSRFLISDEDSRDDGAVVSHDAELAETAAGLSHRELGELWALAQSHHV